MNILDRLNEESKKEFWAGLALRYCEGMSPRLLAKILRHYGSAYQAYQKLTDRQELQNFDSFPQKIKNILQASLKSNTWREKALLEWQNAQKTDCDVILWTDYRYPLALKRIVDAPPFFYAKGNIGLLSLPNIAIVGSRKSHEKSLQQAEQIAEELSNLGISIVSGMALGIDQSAHRGALRGKGKTIAVLGTGINIIYPRQHKELYQRIAEQGLIISEFPPFTEALAQNFPIRNRLITGISEGVVIVEAALKSGSLITARLALEQNKNVYVCRPHNSNHSSGGQKLLDEGAICIDDCQGIIAELVPQFMTEYEQLKIETKNQGDLSPVPVLPLAQLAQSEQKEKKPLSQTNPEKAYRKKNYPAQNILARPPVDENLPVMDIDFSSIALDIVNKQSTLRKPALRRFAKKNTRKNSKIITPSMEHDNPILAILQKEASLTADEILIHLQAAGRHMDMADLSTELLMLEVDGLIQKGAGAIYTLA